MIMTSVGGRAHRGPVTRSARAGLGGPRTRIGAIRKTGVCWEGRNAVEDGQGEAFLSREEWARSEQGKKAEQGRCGLGIEAERSDDGLRLDMPNRGRIGRVRPNDGDMTERQTRHTARQRQGHVS